MPPLIPLILAGAGVYAGVRWLSRELAGLAREAGKDFANRPARPAPGPRNLGTLEFDPAANVYRPRSRGRR